MPDKKRPFASEHQTPNVIGASARPVYDKKSFVNDIKDALPDSELMMGMKRTFAEGDVMLHENGQNANLYIILEGYVAQMKEGEGIKTQIGMHGPGEFIGLLSFQTGEPVFTTAKASTKVVALCFDHRNFEVFMNEYPHISKTLQGLIFSNLADRYRKVVMLHVEVASLTRQLEQERNQLKEAINELKRTRNALISQEKMATLGEMTAGLAHEINNPASALLRSIEYLSVNLPVMAERAAALPDTGLVRYFFEAGMKREFSDTSTHRARMKQLVEKFPTISRALIRTMAEMDSVVFDKLKPFITSCKNKALYELLVDSYQSGVFLNNIRLSTSRIEYLVKSLKNYSRQTGSKPELADVRNGIQETLQIMGNRLRDIKVHTEMEEPCMIMSYIGEMNQVWTNIIINACDAMGDEGQLFISCTADKKNGKVNVQIADNGPGVPDNLKQKIFHSSFSTKTAGGEFGLGIGLAISKTIVEKHHGSIEVLNREGGGALFSILLPMC